MDFLATRRTGTTYGKTTKKPLVHDLFDHRAGNLSRPDTDRLHQESTTSHVSTAPNLYSRSIPPLPISQLSPKQAGHSSDDQNGTSSTSLPTHVVVELGHNTFDISSSDDAKATSHAKATKKRRKLASTENRVPKRNLSTVKTVTLSEKSVHAGSPAGRNLAAKSASSTLRKENTRHELSETERKDAVPLVSDKRGTGKKPVVSRPISFVSKKQQSEQSSQSVPQPSQARKPRIKASSSPDAGTTDTDNSVYSLSPVSGTPRRKRPHVDVEEISASPTTLQMKSLKLTTRNHINFLNSRHVESEHGAMISETPKKRVRSRLIDRLDAPSTEHSSEDEATGDYNAPTRERLSTEDAGTESQDHRSVKAIEAERSEGVQVRKTYAARTKATYAKERSYLSDMVDDIDSISAPSHQNSSFTSLLPSEKPAVTSQLELEEDDSDESNGPSRLKSIHELRQAGANKRSEREYQALLEEIESRGPAARSLRLQAYIRLFRQLQDPIFRNHVINSDRVGRLVACASTGIDKTSALLLALGLSTIAHGDAGSPTLTLVFQALLQISSGLIMLDERFSHWIQDRKQNLSKSMVRDLISFEKDVIGQNLLPLFDGSELNLSELIMYCLDHVLRALLRSEGGNINVPPLLHNNILSVLQVQSRQSHTKACPRAQKALQLLEACSIASDEGGIAVSDAKYRELGHSLADLMVQNETDGEAVQQNVLRVVVSLSNSKPKVCRILSETPIIEGILNVVHDHFLEVATQAEFEQELSHGKLDSVILALGCLLNLSESDSSARERLSTAESRQQNAIELLVDIFNSQVERYAEVTTENQSQVMVAFGYLCMVLCTISLDPVARQDIIRRLRNRSFKDLCSAAETFFHHLRTLEKLSHEDESMSAFTQRFQKILETLQVAAI